MGCSNVPIAATPLDSTNFLLFIASGIQDGFDIRSNASAMQFTVSLTAKILIAKTYISQNRLLRISGSRMVRESDLGFRSKKVAGIVGVNRGLLRKTQSLLYRCHFRFARDPTRASWPWTTK